VKRALAASTLVLALVAGLAGAAPAPPTARATALVVRITVPGLPGAVAGEVVAPPSSSTPTPGFAYPVDGSVVRLAASSSSVAAQPGEAASAQGIADVLSVSLFNGEITADSIAVRATVAAGSANASADVTGSSVAGLVVLGQPISPTPGQQVPLADWGTLDVLAGQTESTSTEPRTAHAVVTGLRVRVTVPHGGLPADSEIVVALADASAEATPAPPPAALKPQPEPKPATPRPKPEEREPSPAVREPGRSVAGAPDELVRAVPEGVLPRESGGGYVFPVYGPASFGDSFGAPRGAYVGGWHHGEDIFAPLGTPVLAVADGTVFSVGWNQYGGWRLWLRDRLGNQFYYAHLSAYSPLGLNGRAVRSGDVVGFMGKSGDAEHSPPHLHFEIHPVSMLHLGYHGVIAPYPYLLAWRRAEDVSFTLGRAYLPEGDGPRRANAPPVGAMLLEASDISRASGLQPGALERALAGREAGETTLAVPGR
jgi:murein DD-endopeptidase MepM/ murein hydrolase activator NlpD